MLDQQTLTAYQQDGAAVLRNAISPAWIERLREGVEQNLREPGPYAKHYTRPGNPGMFFGDYCNWQRIEPYREFFFHSNASALAAELMGSSKVEPVPRTRVGRKAGNQGAYAAGTTTSPTTRWMARHREPVDSAESGGARAPAWNSLPAPCLGRWFTPARFVDQKTHTNAQDSRFEPPPDFEATGTVIAWHWRLAIASPSMA
jgi:hypothetical protein